jgi:phage tail sheath protein FI
MAEILSPGVYVEEVPSLAQIVPGVTTSNMGILGYAPQGPANVATLVQSYEQYARTFGGLVAESYMPLSMAAFFANGGRRAYVVRVPPADAVAADAKIQSKTYIDSIEAGDGTTTAFSGSLPTVAGAAPLVPGTTTVTFRGAGTPVTGENTRNADDTADLTLVAGQSSYDGCIDPGSLPAVDLSQDCVVRGTVDLIFDVDASTGGPTQTLSIPVGTGAIVEGSVGDSTNGAVARFDHTTGKFSLRTFGDFIPALIKAELDLATLTSGVVTTVLQAATGGAAGNTITLTFVATGAGVGTLSAVGPAYTFQYATGVTTVANFQSAVAAFPSCLFTVKTVGAAATLTAPTCTFAATNFAGGGTDAGNNITADFTPATVTKTAEDARGAITVVAGASLVDGETVTITHGGVSRTFEFDSNGVSSGVPVPFTGASTASDVQASFIAAINSQTSALLLEAVAVSTNKIKLLPTTGETLSVLLAETVTSGSFSVSPTVASTSGIWVGDVSAAGSLDYSTGAYSFTLTPAPHNKCDVVAAYTRNAWDLNPISVGAWGNRLRVQISGSPNYFTSATGTYSRFDVVVALQDPDTLVYSAVEQYEELVFDDTTSPVYFADVINELSDYISVTEPAGDVAPEQLQSQAKVEVLAGGSQLAANQTVVRTLAFENIKPRTVSISFTSTAGAALTITDDGNGNLIGDVDASGANTIDYETGDVDFKTSATIKGGTLVVASYSTVAEEAAHTEDFGDADKNYTAGEEGTFDSTNWGRDQFTEATALAATYKGLYAFNKVEEILQVVVPDLAGELLSTGDLLDYAATRAAQPSGGDRFIILTTPKGYTAQEAVDWFRFTLGRYSDYAALYWPWVKVSDPLLNGRPKTIPALAHVAGVYARTDNNRNVGKSPGGTTDGALNYLVGLESDPTLADRNICYPNKVNTLISGPQTGLAVWGVATISNTADWRYINARRLFMFLEKSTYNSLWWTVFENNGPSLWAKITAQLDGFLRGLYQSGYFAGTSPAQAYFVICDETNNTAATVEAGQVVVDIGVAPNKPAEFIRLRFQQKSLNS